MCIDELEVLVVIFCYVVGLFDSNIHWVVVDIVRFERCTLAGNEVVNVIIVIVFFIIKYFSVKEKVDGAYFKDGAIWVDDYEYIKTITLTAIVFIYYPWVQEYNL